MNKAYFSTKDKEYFFSGGEAYIIVAALPLTSWPDLLKSDLDSEINNHSCANKALDDMDIYDPDARRRQYVFCCHSALNDTPDTDKNDCEIANCKKRLICKWNGKLCKNHFDLTAREIEYLILNNEGLSDIQISAKMNCSQFTARTHRQNIFRKLNLHKKTSLVTISKNFLA